MGRISAFVMLLAVFATAALAQNCNAKDSFLRYTQDSVNTTLTLATSSLCAESFRVTKIDNKNVKLRGDYKAYPASIFPNSVVSYTDPQAGDPNNGAAALLEKDVFPSQADVPGVFIAQKDVQSVTLKFDQVEKPNTVKVYQTINPGGIKSVEILGSDGKNIIVYSQKDEDLDSGTVRCGQSVLIKNIRRGSLLELAQKDTSFTIRVGQEVESETPTLFKVLCPKRKDAGGVLKYGDLIQLQFQQYFWSDSNNPANVIGVTVDPSGIDSLFTVVDPLDPSSTEPVKRGQSVSFKSNWNRFLELTDFTQGDLKFSSRIIEKESTFTMTITGSQLLEIKFDSPPLPWVAREIKLTIDASKVWRGIDAVELVGIRRVYPTFPGILYSSNLYIETTTTEPSCSSITYSGTDRVEKTIKFCWGSPKGPNGKVCSGNGSCRGGPLSLGDTCVCGEGWIGQTCETLGCPLGPNGVEGAGRLCSGHGRCTGPLKNPPTRDCECEASFTGDACEIRRGDNNGYARTCSAVGDPHWWTFDGAQVNVYSPSVYVELLYYMNPQPWGAEDNEAIVTFTKPWGSFAAIAMEVTFRRGTSYVRVIEGYNLYVNCNGQNIYWDGRMDNAEFQIAGFSIRRYNTYMVRITSMGRSNLMLDVYSWGHPSWGWAYLDIHIHQYEPILNKITDSCNRLGKDCRYDRRGLRGLCGNYDGAAWNDDAPWHQGWDWWNCWQWGWWNCAWWNSPTGEVINRVTIPSPHSFRNCAANSYTAATQGPTSTLLTIADEKIYLDKFVKNVAAHGGPKLDTMTLIQSAMRTQASERSELMESTGMCAMEVIDKLFETCEKKNLACAKKTCHTDFFSTNANFRSLKEVCTKQKDGTFSPVQTVTWNSYTNCIQDSCEAKDLSECKENGDEQEVKEFLEDIRQNVGVAEKSEETTREERLKGE